MDDLNGKEVIVARFQTATHMLGYGNVPTVLDKNTMRTGLKMYKVADGLHLKGKDWEGFMPSGNIVSLQFALSKTK